MSKSNASRLPTWVWDRHANPKSGWSRLLATPLLLAAVYLRRPRLLLATLGFLVVNPILFSEPAADQQDDFMYRVVRAEEAWVDSGRPLFGLEYPQLLNLLNVWASLYAVYAALAQKARQTAFGAGATILLKLWFVAELVRWHDRKEPTE